MKRWAWTWILLTPLGWGTGCVEAADDGAPGSGPCVGAKCDDPGADTDDAADTSAEASSCELRRSDAFDLSRPAYTPGAIRWSCADVDGVAPVDRGQEYCDYFAVVQLPGSEPFMHGRIFSDEDGTLQETRTSIDDEERGILEKLDPQMEVGSCVFSAWFAEIDLPECEDCPDLHGLPVTADSFRTRQLNNTWRAAAGIVEACTEWPYDTEASEDDFLRACAHVQNGAGVEWRKSDPILCAATMRLRECGCGLQSGDPLGPALASRDAGGFPLGTWSDPDGLPPGCRYVEVSQGAEHILVACSITAAQLLQNGMEIKDYCRSTYADNVVVHVPVDGSAITCSPPTDGPHASTCSDMPWLVEDDADY
jgi:hypothetical protein